MKPLKKNKNFIFFFIILFCFEFSKCNDLCPNCVSTDGISACAATTTDPSVSCSDCKPKYISGGSSECYNCGSGSVYYTIDSYGECLNDCIGDKIIDGSNECTSRELSSFYKLGDIYYKDAPTDSEIECDTNEICKCKNYYYIETIYGKKNTIVLPQILAHQQVVILIIVLKQKNFFRLDVQQD